MATTADRGRDVRRRLSAAAAAAIAEQGWTGVSTRSLAARAGVGAGLVHYHFASLQDLLREAAVAAARDLLNGIDAILDAADSGPAIVDALLAALSAHDGTDPASLLIAESYLAAARDPLLRRTFGDLLADATARLARRLRAVGVAEPDATAAVILAVVDGVMLHRPLRPATPDVAAVLHRLVATEES